MMLAHDAALPRVTGLGSQECFRETDLAAAEVKRLAPARGQGPLKPRRDPIADPFAFTQPFDQPGFTQDAQMMGHLRLSSPDLPDQVTHALVLDEEGFQDPEARLIAQRPHHSGTLPRGQEHRGHARSLTQQQLPPGAQDTGSPATASPARLKITKCRS